MSVEPFLGVREDRHDVAGALGLRTREPPGAFYRMVLRGPCQPRGHSGSSRRIPFLQVAQKRLSQMYGVRIITQLEIAKV